jgi:hypothetical protein
MEPRGISQGITYRTCSNIDISQVNRASVLTSLPERDGSPPHGSVSSNWILLHLYQQMSRASHLLDPETISTRIRAYPLQLSPANFFTVGQWLS